MNKEQDSYDDDYLEEDGLQYSDIDITGILDPEKFKTTMQRIEDYLEQRKLRNALDDYL